MIAFCSVGIVIGGVFICVARRKRKQEIKKEKNEVIVLDYRGEESLRKVIPAIEPMRDIQYLAKSCNNLPSSGGELETGRGKNCSIELKIIRQNKSAPYP